MLSRQFRADLALVLVTLIWGSTFVVVKNELANIGPMAFIAIRFTFAFLLMALITWKALARMSRAELGAGLLIGVFLFSGYAFQTVGLQYTTASKAAFITGLCVVLAPVIARPVLGHSPSRFAWLGVAMSTVGLAMLSLTDQLTLSMGDLLVLGCAVSFALHVVAISKFAPTMPVLPLVTVQIGMVAVAGWISVGMVEPLPAALGTGTLAVCAFMGIVATAFGFTVQNKVQVFSSPTHTALVLSTEPVFGALFGYLLAGEILSARQALGCVLILGGMLVAEIGRNDSETVAAEKVPPAAKNEITTLKAEG